MSAACRIRRLIPSDASSLMELRQTALQTDPLSFGSSPDNDRFRSREFVDAILADDLEQAVFGGFDDAHQVGMLGVLRESGSKERHKAFLWGMFVSPAARGAGMGRGLLEAAIARAREWNEVSQLQLSVSDTAVAAISLYESLGFQTWGREPRALRCDGRFVDEFHMVLQLRVVLG